MTTTEQFCAIVNCDPADVRDIPAGRIAVAATHVEPAAAKAALGSITLPFGKHRDKPLSEVPREYLHWLAEQPPMDGAKSSTRRGIEKMKRKIRKYLKANR